MAKAARKDKQTGSATVGYEAELWQMADALRGSTDAAEYKHVVLGLIFLKYISDAFEEQHVSLEAQKAQGADPEDPDEYRAHNIFWVPAEARWAHLKAAAKAARAVDRPRHLSHDRRRRQPLEGCDRPHLRVLPVAVCQRRRQEGRRVQQAAV